MLGLGNTVKDKITGFTGVVTGHCNYISGCDQYLVQPKCKEGEFKEARWFDEQRLDVIFGEIVALDNSKGNGADSAAPVK